MPLAFLLHKLNLKKIKYLLKLDIKIVFLLMFILVFNATLNKTSINKYSPKRLPTPDYHHADIIRSNTEFTIDIRILQSYPLENGSGGSSRQALTYCGILFFGLGRYGDMLFI